MCRIFLCLCLTVVTISALPQYRYNVYRPQRSHQRAVMFGSYYGRPIKRNTEYIPVPEGGMTAFAAGDTVATNSYVGGLGSLGPAPNLIEGEILESELPAQSAQSDVFQAVPVDVTTAFPVEVTEAIAVEGVIQEEAVQQESVQQEAVQQEPVQQEAVQQEAVQQEAVQQEAVQPEVVHQVAEVTTSKNSNNVPPKNGSKNKTEKPPVVLDEEDDEESAFWPFQVGSGHSRPIYNAFFPIMLGGLGGARGRNAEGEEIPLPGAATAIANSFSTGKGGVASSRATSYGDPYLSTLLRNGFSLKKNKNFHKDDD